MLPCLEGTRVIGLGNKCRHGKNLAADLICERWPRLCRQYAFADGLKMVARAIHGMTVKDGALLQKLGMQYREADSEIWIRALHWRIQEERPPIAIITDVRLLNEAEWVKSMGGVLVHVQRVNEDGSPFVSPDRDPHHISETQLDTYPWDFTITNVSGQLAKFSMDVEELAYLELLTPHEASCAAT